MFARLDRAGAGTLARLTNRTGGPSVRKWHLPQATLSADGFPLDLELRFRWRGAWRHQRWTFESPGAHDGFIVWPRGETRAATG